MRRVALLALILLSPTASAHVESLPGQGESLASAIWLAKPPAVQHDMIPQHGGIRYFTIDLQANETVRIRLARDPTSFTTEIPPSLAILGPGLAPRGFAPAFLEHPENATAQVTQGVFTPTMDYDPVAALATSTLVALDFTPPRTARYTIAVYDEDQGGGLVLEVGQFAPFGLYRTFGIPRDATELRSWEGQTWSHTSLPTALGIATGIGLAYRLTRARRDRVTGLAWFSLGAAILILASGASYAHQAVHHRALGFATIMPTAGLSAAHLLIAAALTWNGIREPAPPRAWARIRAAALGAASLFLWGGFVWGPCIAIIASIMPEDKPPSEEASS